LESIKRNVPLAVKYFMSLLSTNVLRTVTYTTDSYSFTSYQVSSGADAEVSCDNMSKVTYYSLGQPSYVSVDDFWSGTALASRTVSVLMRQNEEEVSEEDSIKYPVTRTVSDLARDNITADLSLDDEESVLYIPDQRRTFSQASTASEDERPVKKIKILSPKPVSDKMHKPMSKSILCGELPRVQLGEHGRQRLKSLLSSAVKYDAAKRDLVYAIGKVKLASIPQLLQMARVCGLWDEVMKVANTSSHSRR
jgi:hypothetical protein